MRKRTERIAEIIKMTTGLNVKANVIYKNNKIMYAITFFVKEGLGMNVYINDMVEHTDEQIVREVIKIFKSHKNEDIPNFNTNEIIKRQYILDHVIPCLVNKKGNEALLANKPHISFFDMEIVFRVICSEDWSASYMLNDIQMEEENLNLKEVYNASLKNNGPVIKSFFGMTILTNEKNLYGASCILHKITLESIAKQMENDFYILPSSIHETIIVPYNENFPPSFLQDIVKEVNETEVDDDEILTNSVYLYNRFTKQISLVSLEEE